MSTTKLILHYLYHAIMGFAVFAIFAFSISWLYYNFIDGYALPYVKEPIPILNEGHEIAIGDPITMRLEIVKPQNIPVIENDVSITCDDGNLITLTPAPTSGTIPVGEFNTISTTYKLPAKATIGSRCQFNYINTYKINPYLEETVVWSSEWFTVMKGAE